MHAATFPDQTSAALLEVPSTQAAAGSAMSPGSVFRANRWRILATYALFNLENVLRLAQPFVIGLAINDLLARSYRGLLVLLVQHLVHMLIGTLRQMYDTRTFTGIYTALASRVVVEQRARCVDASRVAARSAMAHSYIDFLERDVPVIIRSTYSVAGALAMMAWYDWRLLPWCAALVLPALLINSAYARTTRLLNGHLHDQLEREVETISEAAPRDVRTHYEAIAGWRIRLSDAEAINFSLMELFVLGLILATLVQFCSNPQVEAGSIFAVFRYVMLFITGLDAIPRLVHQMSRMRDISFRIRRAQPD